MFAWKPQRVRPKEIAMEMLKLMVIAAVTVLIGTEVAFAKIEKIKVENASPATRAAGFKTYEGKLLRTKNLVITNKKVIQAKKVIESDFIEMEDGDIYYPEEIEFIYSVNGGKIPRTFKAPKEDEKAPQDSDSN
jgi:hypothetical protein